MTIESPEPPWVICKHGILIVEEGKRKDICFECEHSMVWYILFAVRINFWYNIEQAADYATKMETELKAFMVAKK